MSLLIFDLSCCLTQVLANLGAADIDSRLEEQLIDGILFSFQEQTNEVNTLSRSDVALLMHFIIIIAHNYSQYGTVNPRLCVHSTSGLFG